jgi:hypothetical protein
MLVTSTYDITSATSCGARRSVPPPFSSTASPSPRTPQVVGELEWVLYDLVEDKVVTSFHVSVIEGSLPHLRVLGRSV